MSDLHSGKERNQSVPDSNTPGLEEGEGSTPPLKRRRITRACDRCHRGGIKCSQSAQPEICAPCAAFGSPCTYDRPIKRRGPPAKTRDSSTSQDYANVYHPSKSHFRPTYISRPEIGLIGDDWEYQEIASKDTIEQLVDAYRRISYPIQPYFHWPTFRHQVHSGLYRDNRPFFAIVMSVCAMSSARIRDGAAAQLPQYLSMSSTLQDSGSMSEMFYDACVRAIPTDLALATDFNYKRAKALLAMLAIQYGYNRTLCSHLGDYLTMCGIDGFHHESRWPPGLNAIEIQERRRLFWQMYQLDVYAAITWNGIIRHRESQSTVLYPAEVDDDEITESGIQLRPHRRQPFMRGWNFVVDLYRVLENAVNDLRARKTLSPDDPSEPVSSLFERKKGPSASEVLSVVGKLYDQLAPEFKGAKAMTGNEDEDVYGFQAANIILTLQLVKMVMAGTENSSVSQRCMIAGELLDSLASVPTAYIHACGAPMLHHLAGIGHLLGSVIQSPLSQWTYLQVRNVLLAMVDILASFESVLTATAEGGVSARLKAHVARIDQYMTNAALEKQQSQVYHSALPKNAWSSEPLRSTYSQASNNSLNGQDINPPGSGSGSASSITSIKVAISSNLPDNQNQRQYSPDRNNSSHSQQFNDTQAQIQYQPSGTQSQSQSQSQSQLQSYTQSSTTQVHPTWAPTDNISPNTHFQLPDDLFTDWPFDIGQGDAFDFLGNGNGMGFTPLTANSNQIGGQIDVNNNSNNNNTGNGNAFESMDDQTLQGVLGGLFGLTGNNMNPVGEGSSGNIGG